MSFSRIVLRPVSAGILIIALGFYIEIPSPFRVLTPTYFGAVKVSPGLYTDAPKRAPEFRAMIRKAKTNSAKYFGSSDHSPRMVICTTRKCAKAFGLKALGLTVGYHVVLIGPGGVNERTMTHERAHVDLHALLAPIDLLGPRFPHWFDEGLASLVAGDRRFVRSNNPRDADWIKAARTFGQWNALTRARSVSQTYGAATVLVSEIQRKAGNKGLMDLVQRVAGGASFDKEYARIMGS